MEERIYLDHAAAMPVHPGVIRFGRQFLEEFAGNPSTIYQEGLQAQAAVAGAREKVAALVGAKDPPSIIFTSGATESNNIAIRGTALRNAGKEKRVVVSAIEHISVLNPAKDLQKGGFTLTQVPVDHYGVLDLDALGAAVTPRTVVTSVHYANNEIGTIEPIREVAEIVHDRGGYLHVDATDAAGRIPIDVERDGIDLLTLSSNQLGGPTGTGALYIRPGVRVQPVLVGGGQERGLRPGTENVVGIACMGEAARLAGKEMPEEMRRLSAIRDRLITGITGIEDTYLTGHPRERLPHHASFRFPRIEGESIQLAMNMLGIAVATGSACTSMTLEASHVLLAIGLAHDEAHGSMVATLGRGNTLDQVPRVVNAARETVKRLRAITPL
ncbi:cysteine desulfurase [Methanoculleus bourgensis]|jgi:cysteine desulfurase|uniref:Cysteine desulfurase n=1 Tax=Methanoculleus bourgensis TaxID=83986 RepID=A0A0X3BLH2_9EURY|nr:MULTISPECIES: cysteine desulfurase family protein [Methanoculleus]MBT0732069.1 cysteine desulfurase [Methanoculleus bourgensis]MDD3373091.1 cysteine desulfurase family protein [Methanoculleus bourgensis]NMA88369.1 cysteine desulfurase [Methanoculleus bourgensis]NQS78888.1 cysteine desulfurase [Methanoculleus bourgensis]CVK32938.1 cysteine desulfurase (tRNA sulfurtransferase), PLP-dependent [Methanoculleus bourgensis]